MTEILVLVKPPWRQGHQGHPGSPDHRPLTLGEPSAVVVGEPGLRPPRLQDEAGRVRGRQDLRRPRPTSSPAYLVTPKVRVLETLVTPDVAGARC